MMDTTKQAAGCAIDALPKAAKNSAERRASRRRSRSIVIM